MNKENTKNVIAGPCHQPSVRAVLPNPSTCPPITGRCTAISRVTIGNGFYSCNSMELDLRCPPDAHPSLDVRPMQDARSGFPAFYDQVVLEISAHLVGITETR